MARVVAFIPDLLFGSSVVGALSAAGHEPVLASNEAGLRDAVTDADALLVDLVRAVRPAGLKTLAFYSHVEADVRDQGREAGFDLVIPRSRMAREGVALLERLLAPENGDTDPAP